MDKIIIPSCFYHFIDLREREFNVTIVFPKNQRDLRIRNVHRKKLRFPFVLRSLSYLVILHAWEEKEVEIACLSILCLQGEIRSAKKEANS